MDVEPVRRSTALQNAPLVPAWTDVLELLPDAVFIVAGADDAGRILYLNSQASRMFGYERSELIDRSVDLLVPDRSQELHERHRRAFARAPRLRNIGGTLVLRGRRRDGSELPIEVLLKPVDGGATVAIVRDTTERDELEEALRRARDSAVRANEVKSRFLAAASHDLRQPLQTIGNLQAVLARVFQHTEYTAHFALMEEAVRTMDHMLESLVDINRLETGAIQPIIRDFGLQEILPRLRSEFGFSASSKSLQLDVAESAEVVRSDPMLLPVILRNLIGNAIKYTQLGSVRLRLRPEDSQLCIDIIDTGPGIPAEHLPRLFEAFYQIDNPNRDQRRGVGLGLSIVQTICRLLDHMVTIDTRVGHGTTFTVRVPRGVAADSMPEEPIASKAAAPPRAPGTVTILHIEDEPAVAKSMAMLLRLEGYEVVCAASRDEALQHIQVHGVRPDLILSDFQLPMGICGDEVVAEIAGILNLKTPTIILTGDIAQKHIEKAKLLADRVLPKPVDIGLLLCEIDTLMSLRQ